IYRLAKSKFSKDYSTHQVTRVAQKYLTALSEKLGSKPYFFGNEPTELDVVCYGHLSLMLYPALDPHHSILATLIERDYPSLVDFCNRVFDRLSESRECISYTVPSEPNSLISFAACALSGVHHSLRLGWYPIACSIKTLTHQRRAGGRDTTSKSESDRESLATNIRTIVGGLTVFIGYIIVNGIIALPGAMTAGEQDNHQDFSDGIKFQIEGLSNKGRSNSSEERAGDPETKRQSSERTGSNIGGGDGSSGQQSQSDDSDGDYEEEIQDMDQDLEYMDEMAAAAAVDDDDGVNDGEEYNQGEDNDGSDYE
ncbi:hypothetical protein EV182_002900, partial [Spiromyces aspiralis]